MGKKGRWSLALAASVVFAAVVTATPAAAKSSAPAPSTHARNSSPLANIGISGLRHNLLAGHTGQAMKMPVANQPLVACQTGWRVVANQDGTWNNSLGGVASITPTDIWAVGNSQSPIPAANGSGDLNLAEHWNGSYWSIVPTPNLGVDGNDLNDVAAITTNDVWAVGRANTGNVFSAVALHWNGTAWSNGNAAVPPTQSELDDVVAFSSTDVWAAGWYLANIGGTLVAQTLVEHFTGTAWQMITPPNANTSINVLGGIGGTSATNLYAVGYFQNGANGRDGFIIHSTDGAGATWTSTALPLLGDNVLTSVNALATNDALAVGFQSGASSTVEAFHFNGTIWTDVSATAQPNPYNVLGDVLAVSAASSYAAIGFDFTSVTAPAQPLAGTWNGTAWSFTTPASTSPMLNNALFSLAIPSANDVWAVGQSDIKSGLSQNLIDQFSDAAAPSGVTATTGADQSSMVSWTAPCAGTGFTSYVVTASDGCTIQGQMTVTGAPPATTVNFTGLTNGTRYTFTVAAVNSYGLGAQSPASTVVVPSGPTAQTAYTACSSQQYTLSGNNGAIWMDMDATNLAQTFSPPVAGVAVLTANVDLWTAAAGFNQDVGIAVSGGGGVGPTYPTVMGQPEAWKESGGSAGTFSPNAAYVQTAIGVVPTDSYTVKVQWKAQQPDSNLIAAAAGPIGPGFSPTRLTIQIIPVTANQFFSKVSTQQYTNANSDGSTWKDVDTTNLSVPFTVPAAGTWNALVMGNADLWTANAGVNQDIGIAMSGTGFPTTSGQPETWKESGGFAGTFSPNAAFVEGVLPVIAGMSYTARLVWKASHLATGATIAAGAGPIASKFSPTTLFVILIPAPATFAKSTAQYTQPNSDGNTWVPVDINNLKVGITAAANTSYVVSGNADLWTANSGYNQDIGIMVSGGAYGPNGTLVAWKESGGLAGTFSPNAAFVTTDLHLQTGGPYTVWLVWKANQLAKVSNAIFIGAGPINTFFSPTWLSVMQVSQP